MKIGLFDVDSHHFPNLCLMKLAAYHKAQGDQVAWWEPSGRYDMVYKSRVFTDTYSKDTVAISNAEQVVQGGTALISRRLWSISALITAFIHSFPAPPTVS